ncbi:RNA-binding protein [Schizosaccharomyces japonicus yFS275]|uniref:RNA-binding protein n=1 Tax=Schizosaccharomyces japonicus (strain yFS275 / FY16936) TaxID=402676 RepID=B6JWS1_SCHJY|nr:RNA-binding protein [Schizosaccharomyces japonicus yFS275]EEB05822.1 RNA-binding protein [Schizosaccharomyces japonicus yFS275]
MQFTDELAIKDVGSYGIYKRRGRVKFVKSKELTSSIQTEEHTGANISEFYRSLFSERTTDQNKQVDTPLATPQTYTCTVCNLEVPTGSRLKHEQATAHLSSKAHIQNNYRPSLIKQGHIGYETMSRLGWSPNNQAGLGASSQGRIYALKTDKIKNDSFGIGFDYTVNTIRKQNRQSLGKRECCRMHKEEVRKKQMLLQYFSH